MDNYWWYIDYQKYHANDARSIGSYFNINNNSENKIFVSNGHSDNTENSN